MKLALFDFQDEALAELRAKLMAARQIASIDNPQAISFSAPTGSGKTIIMTALFEQLLFGDVGFPPQPDAVVLWLSDMPELNEQTRLKIEAKSDRIRPRHLNIIDQAFDAERLVGGQIYFMNTQKLGEDKRLTRRGDGRQYTIWETLSNTAQSSFGRFYVVIDEAHRGMREGRGEESAKTIIQRFVKGSKDHGLVRMPLLIGMSATPRRFEDLLAGTTHTVHKVYVPPDVVRQSGLLKDRVLIHFPDDAHGAEMSLVVEAAHRWVTMHERWDEYCRQENERPVQPILVVQVEDGTAGEITKTDLDALLSNIESAIGRRLREGEVTHTFNDCGDLTVHGRSIRRVDASRIEEDSRVGVVLFKMSLSTGWDCPRAEVMMSFRRAQDHTYIAQLLGRMVRTPLARRIENDAALNDVHLLLPHFDQAAVSAVIKDLEDVEDVPPTETGTTRHLVTLTRRAGLEALFAEWDKLVTYRVDAARKQSALRRLVGLARALTFDGIDDVALGRVKTEILETVNRGVQQLAASPRYDELILHVTQVGLKTATVEQGTANVDWGPDYGVDTAATDIDQQFEQAGRQLGNGLHMDYWRAHAERDAMEVKTELIVFVQDANAMKTLEAFAETAFDGLYEKYRSMLAGLREERRIHYDKLRLATASPKDIPWYLPEVIDFRRTPDAPMLDRHLFVEDDGYFRADLGTWEREVIEEELRDPTVVGWLRNMDRKLWSLEIPYRDGGVIKSMFPDMVVVRREGRGFVFDILEPHDPSLRDNAAKARGLAEFAERHGHLFSRIELIRKQRSAAATDQYFRLDVNRGVVRRRVLGIEDNNHLDEIFRQEAH